MSGVRNADGKHRTSADSGARQRLLTGVPVSERRLRIGGASTSVLEGGDGPPLLLLHGGIETGGIYWAPVMAQLSTSWRIVVPDLPGLGASESAGPLNAAALGEWLTDVIRMTCQEQPVLVAHSMLGSLAARFAATHGRLLRRLVVMSSPGIARYRIPLGLAVTAIRFDLRPTERNHARFAAWAFLDPDRTRRRDPEWYDAFMAYGLSRGSDPQVKRTMRRLIKIGSKRIPDEELRRIEVPTALLWGARDRMTPVSVGGSASAHLGWPLYVIDDAGHVPFIEQPDSFLQASRSALGTFDPSSS